MSTKKKKTILRTIRLSEDVDALLERNSQDQNISTNTLIGKIMTRYVEWDRIIEKTSGVIISSLLFRALINEICDEKLEEIGKDAGAKVVKDIAMMAFGKENLDTLLKTWLLIGKYSTGLRVSAPLPGESKVEGQYVLTLHHDWGPKGSVLLRSWFDCVARIDLEKRPTVSVTDDAVTVSFPKILK